MSETTTATIATMPQADADKIMSEAVAQAVALGMSDKDAKLFAQAKVRDAKAEFRRNLREASDEKRDNPTFEFLDVVADSLLRAVEHFKLDDDGASPESVEVANYLYDLADSFNSVTSLPTTQMAGNLRVKGADIAQMPRVRRNRRNNATPAKASK